MDRKKKKQAGIFCCLLLIWMGVIFWFSAQKAVQSSHISHGISYRVVEYFCGDEKSEEEIEAWSERIEYPIRKAAHMSEYAVLGMLFIGAMSAWERSQKQKYILAQLGASCYAMTDEFHQTFVQGRDGSPRDVLIDSVGCLLGLLLLFVFWHLYRKHRTKRELRENI